jgi:hypothetical protein
MRAAVPAGRKALADTPLLPQLARLMRERDPELVVCLPAAEIVFVWLEAARYGVSVEAMLRTLGKEGLRAQQGRLCNGSGACRLRLPSAAASDVNVFATWLVRRAIRRRRRGHPREGEHAHPGPPVELH